MDDRQREYFTHRIISGKVRCQTVFGLFYIKTPSHEEKYIAEQIYEETYEEAICGGAYSKDAFSVFLEEKGVWTPISQAKHDKLTKNLEDLKVNLFHSFLDSGLRFQLKEAIEKTKLELSTLNEKLRSYDYVSADGISLLQKMKFLTAMSIYGSDDKKVFTTESYWFADTKILEAVSVQINKLRLQEQDIRLIARTEPWRSIWFCNKSTRSIFPCSAVELTDEQRMLVYWSQIYDNIHESPKCPPEDLIADDDALDGWFIVQSRSRKQETDKDWLESKITNPNIKNSSEVFIKVNKDDASRVYGVNDVMGRAKQRALFKKIEKDGVIEVSNTPDAVFEKAQQLQQMYKEKVTA